MLSLRTSDDWSAAQVTINEGGAQVFTFDATHNSAYDAAVALVAWATTTFAGTYSWSWSAHTDAGAKITISSTNAFTMTADAEAQTLLGLNASYGSGTSHTGSNSAAGTWDPSVQVGLRRWLRRLGDGRGGGIGSTRPGVPATATRAPRCEVAATKAELARLVDLQSSTFQPRQGWIYQSHIDSGTWRLVAVGQISHTYNGGLLYRVSLDLRG